MRARFGIVGALLLLGLAVVLAPGVSANHSYGATYTGSVSAGGEVEFVVAPDGSAVTHFELRGVPTECGTISTEVDGTWAIANHAFGNTAGFVRFSGAFPAAQAAEGTVQYKYAGYPSCTSSVLSWTATTPTPPPATPTPTTTPPPGADTTPPAISLSGKLTQRPARAVKVTVESDENAVAKATGKVKAGRKRYRLGTASERLAAGEPETLALSVPRKARTAIRRALAKGGRVTASLIVTVTDLAGNDESATRSVRIR